MAGTVRFYTPAEAGAISGLKLKAVHNAIDKRIVEPVPAAWRTRARLLTVEDLVRLRVWRGVGDSLSVDRRRRLFTAMASQPTARTVKADDLLIIDVGEARKQVGKGLRDLDEAEAVVTRDRATLGGEPVFKGTRIPVRGIDAMLAAGADLEDLLSGYPNLSPRLIELARIWTAAHPRRGRPRSLADLGLALKSSKRTPLKPDPLTRIAARATVKG